MRQTKNKFGQKLLAQLLAICIGVFTMLPTAAFAEETTPQQQPVDSGIMEVEDETTSADVPTVYAVGSDSALQLDADGIGDGDTVYFGKYTENGTTYDVPWTVLPSTTLSETSVAGTDVLPLLSTYTLGATKFQSSGSGYYPSSTLQATMASIYNNFADLEKGAVAETTLTESSMYSDQGSLAAERLFPLSYNETSSLGEDNTLLQAKSITDQTGNTNGWWLRSSMMDDEAYCVYSRFPFDASRVVNPLAVRPAFHLDKSVILLTSAADGKVSGTLGATALTAVPTTTPSAWKLTISDAAHADFAVTTATRNGDVLTVSYTGATVYHADTAPNEYISAMILNGTSGAITHYGRLAQPTAADGTVDIDLSDVAMGSSDILYLLNEQYNGDNKTDYASQLKEVSMPSAPGSDLTVTGGTEDTDYTYSGGVLKILTGTPMTISMADDVTTTTDRIVIADGKTANLTLNGVTVDMSASTFAAIDLENGAKLNLTVSGVNTLTGGEKCAGISVPEGTTLSINGSGTLNVFGGMFGAGIGGGTVTLANAVHPEYEFYGADAGTINISGGTVNATGGQWAAGIGGGAGFERENENVVGGSGGTINISGGTVNASAGVGGIHPTHGEFGGSAGIGGGGALGTELGGAGGSITISGGTVNADSVDSDNMSVGGGAAIGGGYPGEAGNITIPAGTVVAQAGLGGAGIGSGSFCDKGGVIKISDGSVTATGGKSAAGIGTGWTDGIGSTPPIEIVISGGRVTAIGGNGLVHPTRGTMGAGAGIGGGYRDVGSDVTISGGIVTAIGGGLSGAYDDDSTVPSAIGAGSNNSGTHSFSTGQSGSAVINAKTPETPFSGYITDQSNKANWLGTIFEGTGGTVYGSQTINDDFTIDAGQALEIPSAASFTIVEGVTVTNNGTIENNGLSRNSGTIAGSGTVTCNNHNWDAATYTAPKTCAFCKITEGEPLPQYTISVSASPEAGGSVTGDGKFDENASRTVTAKANTNYHFVKWTESGTQVSTNASYTFNLTADRTLVAVFEADTPTPATQYQVTKGKNGIWTKGNIGGLEFTVNTNYSKFTTGGSVLVDGTEIASDKYTSQSGSTIITLKAEYLETLSAGQHSLRVNFADGYAETHFTIKAATAETGGNGDDDQNPNTGVPQTGDNSYMPLWILLILISAGGIITVGIKQKKRKS
ncbi:MAG: DUF6273 domain-containing protein [Oscillospiraceae bacterium]|nr:DUF6273 domain-containing protein [Oscillospiraceae bacterium]